MRLVSCSPFLVLVLSAALPARTLVVDPSGGGDHTEIQPAIDAAADGDTGGVSDAIALLAFNFLGSGEPACLAACDANGDGETGGTLDAIWLLMHNFLGGPSIPPPFPACGPSVHASDVALGCNRPPESCR